MKHIHYFLKRINLYYRIRYSIFYRYYLKWKNPLLIDAENKELAFLSQLIQPGQLIYDIGANSGEYTNLYRRLRSKVIAVEPDKTNVKILRTRFGGSRDVTILEKAVSNKTGVEELYINGDGSGFNTMSEKWKLSLQDSSVNRWKIRFDFKKSYKIETITLDQIIAQYGVPFFIKIDVEGYEYNVLSSLNAKIELLNLEANLPEFIEETILIIEHLLKIDGGYKFNIDDQYNFVFDTWKNGNDFSKFVRDTERRYLDIWVKA